MAGVGVIWFLATDAAIYLTVTPEKFTGYYWPRRMGLMLHVGSGAFALSIGLVQVWLGFSGRTRSLHRWFGRLYAVSVFIGSLGSLYLAATIPEGSLIYTSGLVGFGLAWFTTTSIGLWSAIRGDVAVHRRWMIRSYVVTFGFVSLRVIVMIITALGLMSEVDANSAAAWACWVGPLTILEIVFRRGPWSNHRPQNAVGS